MTLGQIGNLYDRHAKMKVWDRIKFFLVGILGATLIRLMGWSWRVHWENLDLERQLIAEYGGVIFAFWHSQMLMPSFTHRNRAIRIMISSSKDGELIARTVGNLGFVPVRGSSSRRGMRALIEMIRDGKQGHLLAITPDGPRGPRYQAQTGVVLLGKGSGLPVLSVGIAAKKRRKLNSWDRFCIPNFFTDVVIYYDQPVIVPPDIAPEAQESYRHRIEASMLATQEKAERYWDQGL